MEVSFVFSYSITPTGRIFGHSPTHNTSLCVFPAKEVPFGLRKMKFQIWPPSPLAWKNVKIGN